LDLVVIGSTLVATYFLPSILETHIKTFDELANETELFGEFEYKGYMWLKFSETDCAQILDNDGNFKKAPSTISFGKFWKEITGE